MEWHFLYIYLYDAITLLEIFRASKAKKQPFRGVPSQILFKNFAEILNYFSLRFRNLGVVVFRKHLSVAAFKVINIHS